LNKHGEIGVKFYRYKIKVHSLSSHHSDYWVFRCFRIYLLCARL
jgi:hypothetical protein